MNITEYKKMIGKRYRHFKGGVYIVSDIAVCCETEQTLVVYKSCDNPLLKWVRPLNTFLSEVDHEKYPDVKQVMRFEEMLDDVEKKMTEYEVLDYLDKLHSKIVRSSFSKNVTENEVLALVYAKKYLGEIQQYRAIGTVEEFKKSVKEEDVLKFYYIESEDKYVVGQRIDTRYYAEVGKTGLCFYMSRYLPWGEDGFSSEPKEIPFFDWLQGFVKKEYGGTMEEFKALKEKNEPKKPILKQYFEDMEEEYLCCPNCAEILTDRISLDNKDFYFHCLNCGQKLDWK